MEAEFILLLRQVRNDKYNSIQIIPEVSTSSQQVDNKRSTTSTSNLTTTVAVVKRNSLGVEESDFIHQLDDPNHVAMPFPIDPTQAQLILVRLLDVIQRQIKSGQLETLDDWQAQVIQRLI